MGAPLGGHKFWPWAVGAAMAMGAVLTVVGQSAIRLVEARISAAIIGASQVAPAQSIGPSVVFPLRGAFVGFTLSVGCTAALLVTPFFLLAGALVVTRRTSVQRGLVTLGVLIVSLFAVNQLRLLVVALSMRVWGFELGYEISHVLLGSIVSTLGVLAGVLLYVRTVFRSRAATELRG